MEQMPTEWEQDVAEIYVNGRKINRPNTGIKKALWFMLLLALVTGISVWLVHFVLINVGFLASLPAWIQDFYSTRPFLSIVVVCMCIVVVELFFCFKHMIIGSIRLYQRYAHENVRRRCLFKPTCSEYAILAVQKYGGIIGLYKTYYRLVYLCKGNIYKIHYPWDK
jgi:putative component of membrane protein insertase Oxa1/YidC/SpoIIIJ protein YidD